jgi:SagB-type dehydrogenase family enzyme
MKPSAARILLGVTLILGLSAAPSAAARAQQAASGSIRLPEARRVGPMSVEAALWERRSTRTFARDSLALADLGQLLWAAQGVNRPNAHRTAPSAMATYPLELYVVASRVRDLPAGVYHYTPATHEVERLAAGDRLAELASSAARSAWVGDAAAVVVFAGAFDRAGSRMRDRAERWIAIEVGAAAQNLALEAAALGLGSTFVGSLQDSTLTRIAMLAPGQRPMGLMPVGRPR